MWTDCNKVNAHSELFAAGVNAHSELDAAARIAIVIWLP